MGQEPDKSLATTKGTEVAREDLVETFTVREGDKRIKVAANNMANKAMMQINVAKLRAICERVIDSLAQDPNAVPDIRELKILVDAISTVEEMGEAAYSASGKTGKLSNALERMMYATTRAAIDGGANLAAASADTAEGRLLRLRRLGKQREEKIVDVTPAKQ